MDDSPRHERGMDYEAVDLNAFTAHDCQCLARIAQLLGKPEDAGTWNSHASRLTALMNRHLWDEQTGLYMDRYFDGSRSECQAVSGFLPWLSGTPSEKRSKRMLGTLMDASRFWTSFPVPSIAAASPQYCTVYWRGPTWINMNFCIIRGLQRCGHREAAAHLADLTVRRVHKWWQCTGTFSEFYDSAGRISPAHTKTRLTPKREPYLCRRDYGWSAAVYVRLLYDQLTQDLSEDTAARST